MISGLTKATAAVALTAVFAATAGTATGHPCRSSRNYYTSSYSYPSYSYGYNTGYYPASSYYYPASSYSYGYGGGYDGSSALMGGLVGLGLGYALWH